MWSLMPLMNVSMSRRTARPSLPWRLSTWVCLAISASVSGWARSSAGSSSSPTAVSPERRSPRRGRCSAQLTEQLAILRRDPAGRPHSVVVCLGRDVGDVVAVAKDRHALARDRLLGARPVRADAESLRLEVLAEVVAGDLVEEGGEAVVELCLASRLGGRGKSPHWPDGIMLRRRLCRVLHSRVRRSTRFRAAPSPQSATRSHVASCSPLRALPVGRRANPAGTIYEGRPGGRPQDRAPARARILCSITGGYGNLAPESRE